MATFDQMLARIQTDIKRTDIDTSIKKAINRAVQHYSKERFFFNEAKTTFATIANTETYAYGSGTIPSDIWAIDRMTITRTSTDIYPLPQVSFEDLRYMSTTGTSSPNLPDVWALWNKTFYFYPIPNAVYTMTLYYQPAYADLSATSDTNVFLSYGEDLIESRARAWLYARLLEDPTQAQVAKVEEQEALQALRERSSSVISTGRLSPSN